MISLATLEINSDGLVLSVTTPPNFLLNEKLPTAGNNIFTCWDESSNQKMKDYIHNLFSNAFSCELSFISVDFPIQCTGVKYAEDKALLCLKSIKQEILKESFEIKQKKSLESKLLYTDFAFRYATVPITLINPDASYYDVNDAYCQMMGYSREEMLSMKIQDIDSSPNYSQQKWASHWEKIKQNNNSLIQTKLKKKDGTLINVLIKPNILTLNGQEINCAYIIDITEKKKLEDRLKLVDYAFRNSAVPTHFLKKDGTILDFNENACILLGYTKEEYKKLRVYYINKNVNADGFNALWKSIELDSDAKLVNAKLTTKDNRLIDAEIRLSKIKYNNQELLCSYFVDITEKKQLAEKFEFAQHAFKKSTIPTMFLREDASFYDYNDAYLNEYGYSEEEVRNAKLYDLHGGFDAASWKKYWGVLRESGGLTFESKRKGKDGKFKDVEIRAQIVKYGDLEIDCVYVTDLTEKKKSEERLRLVDFSFRNAATPILLLRPDATFYDFNEAMFEMLGYTKDEFAQLTIPDIDPSFDNDFCKERWEQFRHIKRLTFLNKLKKKDGNFIDVEIRNNLITYGELEINFCFITDISEKKKLEDNLKIIDFAFKNATIPMHFVNKDGTIYDCNDAACELFGYSKEEYKDLTIFDISTRHTPQTWNDRWEELKVRIPQPHITKLKRKDNSLVDVEVRTDILKLHGLDLSFTSFIDITEKKKAEEAIRLSNERYEYATLATSDIVWETDVVNDVCYLGPNFTSIFGHYTTGIEYGPDNIWRNNLHPEDLNRVLSSEASVIAGENEKWVVEYRLKKANGEYANVIDRGFGIRDVSGKVVRLVGAMQDITEKKKNEEELKHSNLRYQYATLATSDVVWESNLRNNTVFISKNLTLFYGHKVEEGFVPIEDSVWRKNVHPDDLQEVLRSESDVINKSGDRWIDEYRFRKADGTYAIILDRSFAIKDENGRVIGMIGAMQDITKRKEEEERIKLFETVIKNTSEAVIIRDANKLESGGLPVLYVNEAFTTMTGYELEEIKGKTLKLLTGPLTQREEQKKIRFAIDNNTSGKMEVINYKKNGETFWAGISIFPVVDGTGKISHWVSIQRDISDRKKAEAEKEVMLQELIRNNKELTQFTYITTHNLRAPLTNLISICNLIKTDKIEDERTLKLIEGFRISTHYLNDTLNDLIKILIIKENPQWDKEQVNFKDVLEKVKTSIHLKLTNMVATIKDDFSEVQSVHFNNAYMESIFLNLVTNSLRYAHPQRYPVITLKTSINPDGSSKLVYSDNGIGMDIERVKNKIFGLYQRFHENPEGKGMGLYLVHSQVTALGGKIEVDSEEGVGTTFTITFK